MKKFLIIVFLILLGVFCYNYYLFNLKNYKDILNDIDEEFYIDNYFVFGTHFFVNGCIDKTINDDLSLILKNNDEEIVIDSKFYVENNKTCFKLSDKNNNGLYLDELNKGEFLLLIKDSEKYYTLKNITEYENIEYYTITKNNKNNKINIDFSEYKDKNYVEFKIEEEKLKEDIYDITIDPGHGGNDPGTISKLNNKEYYESNIVLNISMLLKKELENLGLKVKLTRESDVNITPYGEYGRAVIPNKYNSKYSFSIHLNSSSGVQKYGGVEVYTPNNIDLTLASLIASNMSSIIGYSKKPTGKLENGIYYEFFSKSDIEDSKNSMLEEEMLPYDIKEGIPYMYMIREVGGIITGAYIDGRNEYYGINPYYNSNKVAEPYLIECGYINYNNDLNILVNNPDEIVLSISNAIKEYLNIS